MFCANCGKKLEDGVFYCPQCGHKLYAAVDDKQDVINKQDVIDNRFVWALATVPIMISLLMNIFIGGSILTTIVTIILNIVFLSLDMKAVRNAGENAESWLWMGVVLVPLYLFMRASKTDRNYTYGLTWCGMFLVSLFL